MVFTETRIKGVFVIDPVRNEDERGFFARTFCVDQFQACGLNARLVQCSISFNKARGTLRGLHWQVPPQAECKLVRVTRGAIFDVVVDLRAGSPTFKEHIAMELTSDNRRELYIPEGLAHGFQTLEAETEVLYHMSSVHAPALARGARWNDPAFGIQWPEVEHRIMNERDATYPDFE